MPAIPVIRTGTKIGQYSTSQIVPASAFDNPIDILFGALNDPVGYLNPLSDIGTQNAYVVAFPSGVNLAVAYPQGLGIVFKPANTNTGPSTLNVNSLGVKPIIRYAGTPLLPGDIAAGTFAIVFYDSSGTGQWILLNPAGGLLTTFQNPGLIGHVLRATTDAGSGGTATSGGTTTLYWLPWKGHMTALWDSTVNRWRILEFGTVSFSITGSAANTLYAVGAYWNGSSVVFGTWQVSNANFFPTGFFTDPVWGVASGGINWRLIGWYYTKGTTPSVYWNETVGGLLSFDICNLHGESKAPFVVGGPAEIIVAGTGPLGFCTARQALSTSYGSWSGTEPSYRMTIGTVTITPYGQSAVNIPGSGAFVGRAAQNWGNLSAAGSTFSSYTTLFSHIGPYFCGSITGNVDLVTWYA